MTTHRPLFLSFALLLGLAASSPAASIAVNFGGSDPSETIDPGENTNTLNSLFGLENPVWTNLDRTQPGTTAWITDGTAGFNLTYTASGSGATGSAGVTTDTHDASQQVYRSYLSSDDGGLTTLQFSGLSDYLKSTGAPAYRLTLFLTCTNNGFNGVWIYRGLPADNTPGAITSLPLVAGLSVSFLPNNTYTGTAPFALPVPDGAETNTSGNRGQTTITMDSSNIAGFDPFVEDELTFAFWGRQYTGPLFSETNVAGFAITPIPEPGTSLLALGAAGLLLRRHRRR